MTLLRSLEQFRGLDLLKNGKNYVLVILPAPAYSTVWMVIYKLRRSYPCSPDGESFIISNVSAGLISFSFNGPANCRILCFSRSLPPFQAAKSLVEELVKAEATKNNARRANI